MPSSRWCGVRELPMPGGAGLLGPASTAGAKSVSRSLRVFSPGSPMKIIGQVRVKAARAAVYEALCDARFFASCVEGVHDLTEIAPDRYQATLETKVAYMSFKFKV